MNKQKDLVSSLIKILLVGAFLYVWGILFFYPNNLSSQFVLPNTYIFAGVFIMVIISANLLAGYHTKVPKYTERLWRENLALFIASVFLLGLQLFITWNVVFRTSWDPGAVWYGSNYAAYNDIDGMGTMSEYFSIYPNNLLLVYFYSRILKFNMLFGTPFSNGILLLALCQCVLLTITGILVFKCARHYVSVKAAWGVYILYVVLIGLSAWMVIPYSDSTGVIFPILLLGIYIKMKEEDSLWKTYSLLFLMAGLGCIGFQIKPMSAIVLIAAGGMELINWIKRSAEERKITEIRQLVCKILVAGAAFFIVSQITTALISQMHFDIDPQRQLGWQHHLMLGANTESNGGFSEKDLAFSSGFSNLKVKNAEELKVFRERMKEMGVHGYFDLFARKASKNYLNGTFGWGGVGDSFYTEIYPLRGNRLCDFLRSWYYDNDVDNLYKYNALFRQILWFFALVTVPFMAVTKRQYMDTEKVLIVSVLGLMLYLQLFESHSRYVFTFVPLFCIMAMGGYGELQKLFWKAR